MTQRKKSITIHETRSVVDITSILTQFGRWAALVLIVTGDGNCIQYRDVNTRHRTQYTSQKKSKWKQNDNSALWTMSSSKRIANTIIVMMHYREHHLHSTTQRKNLPQKSRNKLFFFTIQLESNKNIQNQMQQRNLQHEGMHHNNSTTPQMSHDYFDTRLGLHQELSRHYQLGLWQVAIIALRRLAGHHFIAEGQSAIAAGP